VVSEVDVMSDDPWFKDAVIYELHVRSFFDSNQDGVGDFPGLLERLPYLEKLGVTALWLLPFYPSPLRDDGYDIADYFDIHPGYGTLEDFRRFLAEAHARGIRVITELVLNHTSDQCAWFRRARSAAPGTVEREFYVWSDDPTRYGEARVIFQDFESSNWSWDAEARSYYWHRFYSHQPDLNFENPRVRESMFAVVDFWLGMGVDGLRLDAVPYLYEAEGGNCENLPATHAFLRELRRHVDTRFPDRVLLAEANQWPEDAAAYFGSGDEAHMCFHFPLMPRLFMALQMEDRHPVVEIVEQTPELPAGCQWATFLRNHDELTLEMVTDQERDYMCRVYAADPRARINLGIRRRLAPLLRNSRRRIELINALLFSLPGTPVVYYGDEIGMGDNFFLGDRDGVRTPMQWSPDRNAGFSRVNPQELYLPVVIEPEYHYQSVNVENQERNPGSLFWWMRRLIALRREWSVLGGGELKFLHPENAKVLAYVRSAGGCSVLVVANLSRFAQAVVLDLGGYLGCVPKELFGGGVFPEVNCPLYPVTLGPHDFYWLRLREAGVIGSMPPVQTVPLLRVTDRWEPAFLGQLQARVLPGYLAGCRWFGGKSGALGEVRIARVLPFGDGDLDARLLVLEVSSVEGGSENYLLALQWAEGEGAQRIAEESPKAVVAWDAEGRLLFDALWDEAFRRTLLEVVLGKRTLGDGGCRVRATRGRALTDELAERLRAHSHVLKAEQSNSGVVFGNQGLFKLYRKLERGPHREAEITRVLGEEQGFRNVPAFLGSLELEEGGGASAVLGLMVGFVDNQGDGWTYTVDALGRFLERVLASQAAGGMEWGDVVGGVYPERVRQLGRRTGEMHRALAAGGVGNPSFAPERITRLWQRSLYQGMRSASARALRLLSRDIGRLAEVELGLARELLLLGAGIGERQEAIVGLPIECSRIMVHGDFHLGQVLNTGDDFLLIDFEGEPRRPISERMLKRPALVDVAGMLRSLDYAAQFALRGVAAEDVVLLRPWAERWVKDMSSAYLDAYREATRGADFIPTRDRDFDVLLDTLLLEKAVYELEYELAFRPDWAGIPMRALLGLLKADRPL